MTRESGAELTLEQLLAQKTVPELRELAKGYYVHGQSKMKKEQLIAAVEAALRDPERLAELLYFVDVPTWSLFRRAAGKGSIVLPGDASPQYKLLTDSCYLHCTKDGGKTRVTVPAEVREVFSAMLADGFRQRKERFDLLHTYAMAATNLYGVIRQDDFIALFNSQNQKPTSDAELFPVLIRHIAVDAPYCLWEEYLVCDEFEENEFQDVPDLLARIGDKPRYIPPKAQLLQYADWRYFEPNVHTARLERYLIQAMGQTQEAAKEILSEIRFACAVESNFQAKVDILNEYGIRLSSQQQVSEIASLIMEVSNSTRLWSNNGHTPNELFELHERKMLLPRPDQPSKRVKVGRNDPCPCGSGKKYKKCCGR